MPTSRELRPFYKNAIKNVDITETEKEKVGVKRDPHKTVIGHICKNQTPESVKSSNSKQNKTLIRYGGKAGV